MSNPTMEHLTIDDITYDIVDSTSGYTTNTGTVQGTGSNNYLAKWTGSSTIGMGPQLDSSYNVYYLRRDGNWRQPG